MLYRSVGTSDDRSSLTKSVLLCKTFSRWACTARQRLETQTLQCNCRVWITQGRKLTASTERAAVEWCNYPTRGVLENVRVFGSLMVT